MEELESLFSKWEKRHIEAGHKRFIRDGIVDEAWWREEKDTPKICYFLKEARTERENGYDLAKDLYRRRPWRLWQKVAVWTQAVQNAFIGEIAYNEEELKKNAHSAVKKIAVVNVKKSDGRISSDSEDLKTYIKADKDDLKKELELIDPDIIICGYTFDMLKVVLGDELNADKIYDKKYGFWRDKLVIDYYHPACRYPNRVNYYALWSICRIAAGEWEERKQALK